MINGLHIYYDINGIWGNRVKREHVSAVLSPGTVSPLQSTSTGTSLCNEQKSKLWPQRQMVTSPCKIKRMFYDWNVKHLTILLILTAEGDFPML